MAERFATANTCSDGHSTAQMTIDTLVDGPKANARFGKNLLAVARILTGEGKLGDALTSIESFKGLTQVPSTLEVMVLEDLTFERGLLLRLRGEFSRAEHLFQTLLKQTRFPERLPYLSIQTADTLCELGRADEAETLLAERREVSQSRDEQMLLRMCLVEVYLCQEMYDLAAGVADTITAADFFDPPLDRRADIWELRTLLTRAKIQHIYQRWTTASAQWQEVLDVIGRRHAYGEALEWIVLYSISDIKLREGDLAAFDDFFERASSCYDQAKPRPTAWLGTLGTKWIDWVNQSVAQKSGRAIIEVS